MKNMNKVSIVLVILLYLSLNSYACLPETVDEWIAWAEENDVNCNVYTSAEDFFDNASSYVIDEVLFSLSQTETGIDDMIEFTGICDDGTNTYNESACDEAVALSPTDSGDPCDGGSYLYNVDDCNEQTGETEDLQYDQDACNPWNADYDPDYCSSLCDGGSDNYNEIGCELSNCIDGSPNYSDEECNASSCSSWSPNYDEAYCSSLCDEGSNNYDEVSCEVSNCIDDSPNYSDEECNASSCNSWSPNYDAEYCASLCNQNSENYDLMGCYISKSSINIQSLSEVEKSLLKMVLEQMEKNCYFSSLMDNITNVNIEMLASKSTPTYDPTTNTITFDVDADINVHSYAAELFHAFQQQLTGIPLEIYNNKTDCTGSSNIEFEEHLSQIVEGVLTGSYDYFITIGSGLEGVDTWVFNLIVNNNGKFPTSFTLAQRNEYLYYVTQFQQAHLGSHYGCPVDASMSEPTSIFAVISNSNCL